MPTISYQYEKIPFELSLKKGHDHGEIWGPSARGILKCGEIFITQRHLKQDLHPSHKVSFIRCAMRQLQISYVKPGSQNYSM
jgi:hypothetical protein